MEFREGCEFGYDQIHVGPGVDNSYEDSFYDVRKMQTRDPFLKIMKERFMQNMRNDAGPMSDYQKHNNKMQFVENIENHLRPHSAPAPLPPPKQTIEHVFVQKQMESNNSDGFKGSNNCSCNGTTKANSSVCCSKANDNLLIFLFLVVVMVCICQYNNIQELNSLLKERIRDNTKSNE